MRRSYLFSILLLPLLALAQINLALAQPASQTPPPRYAPDNVLVKFKQGVPAAEQGRAHQQVKGQVIQVLQSLSVQVVRIPLDTVEAALQAYQKNPNVEYAEPNYRRLLYLPVTNEGSEPSLGIANNFTEQWGLHNTGQGFGANVDPLFGTITTPAYYGSADADIDAPEGWGADRFGDPNVGIAVLDSGVDCDHLDLAGKCIEQVNFVARHGSSLQDVLGHGTHVAGIAAATTDNGIGIAGVARRSLIGAHKVCWEDDSLLWLYGVIVGQCEDADVAAAIDHVVSSGVYKVINMSLAGPDHSLTLERAVNNAWNAGIVIVGAAGNAYSKDVMYPAAYDNVIAVGSTDHHDNLSSFSTFGKQWVSVLAPGTQIVSTVPGGFCGQEGVPSDCYDWKSGTSMATPHVAGLAALLWAHLPSPTNVAVRDAVETSADATGALNQNFQAWAEHGRINLNAALNSQGGGGGGGGGQEAVTHSVSSIVLGTVNVGRGSKLGEARVAMIDNLGNPVVGATVTGTFEAPFNESPSATTDASGVATLSTQSSQKGGFTFTFCVDDVTASGTTYQASPGGDCATF